MARAISAIALLALGCDGAVRANGPQEPKPWFEDRAATAGLDFVHCSGHRDRYLFPEIACGGAALFDMDGDGDLDAYLVQAGNLIDPPESRPANRLFRNRGDGTFEDVSEGSGAEDRGYGMGVATGDYDNDGDVDLYVTNVGPNVLLQDVGGGRFEDVTAKAGVGDPSWSSSAAFFDPDADGDLDLFVVNYVRWSIGGELLCQGPPRGPDYCSPKSYAAPAPSTLYRNQGDGTFVDVSTEAGLRSAFGNGLGVLCGDFDGDGRVDVFVSNDGTPNQLWRNLGGCRFEDRALLAGCAVDQNGAAKAGMGVAAADVDDDGDEDVLVVNLRGESDSFYRNEGSYFSDRTALVGLGVESRTFTRFGCGLEDLDDDGWIDLFLANGRVFRAAESFSSDPYAEPKLLLRGTSAGRFEPVTPRGGTRKDLIATGRGAAFGDVDGDGAIDVLVVNRDGPANLLVNVAAPREGSRNNWIAVRLVEEHGRDALGAVLTARLAARRILRVCRSATGYCSASDPRVHVGLGAERSLEEVAVLWPDGARESFGSLPAGSVATLRKGTGAPASSSR